MLIKNSAFVIFPSSNYVYDGSVPFRKIEDACCPRTEYGRQKAEVERQLLAMGVPVSIVRFTKIVHKNMSLLRTWTSDLKTGHAIHPFSDMSMAPVSLDFCVDVLRCVAERRLSGILQVSAKNDISYEAAARYLASRVGAPDHLIKPMMSADAGIDPSDVPRNTTLDASRLSDECGLFPPDAWKALDAFI
jgi:dTDP-4-dehydrorhamnose reductase